MKMPTICALWVMVVLSSSGAVHAAEPAEGLRADFDDGTLGGVTNPLFISAKTGADPNAAKWEIKDGVLSIRCDFDPDNLKRVSDYVEMTLPDAGMASVTDYPVFEMCLRMSNHVGDVLVQCTYEYLDGSRQTPYFYADYGGKESEWVTVATRLVGDSFLPTKWTPRKLVSIYMRLRCEGPLVADFDWIRLRTLNDDEREKEDQWLALVKDYKPEESAITKEFFPFGVYCTGPFSSSIHSMTRRSYVRIVSMNHLNYIQDQPDLGPAEEMGVRASVRTRNGGYYFERDGYQKMFDYTKAAVDSLKNSPALVCYDLGDEKPIAALWGTAAGIALLNQLDPDHDCVLTSWDPAAIRAYSAYVSVDLADIYPMQDNGAASLYDWCRQVARDSDNKRQWLILQSFGCAPWRSRTGYNIPTVEQLRLEVWSALAGGARGIILYDLSYDRYRMMIDSWGNPNELMAEARRLGEILIPRGQRLLDCTVDFDTKIACDNKNILVGVVRARAREATYVILANKDEKAQQGGRLTGPEGDLFDLVSLKPVSGNEVEPLLPGDGRIYFVGAQVDFEAEKQTILQNREQEELRAQTPARLFKERRGDPKVLQILDEIGSAMGRFEPAMYKDNPDPQVVELINPHFDRYWTLYARWTAAYDDLLAGRTVEDARDMLAESRKIASDIQEALGDHPMYPGAQTNREPVLAPDRLGRGQL